MKKCLFLYAFILLSLFLSVRLVSAHPEYTRAGILILGYISIISTWLIKKLPE